jgi:hypothetical protein
MMKRQWKIATAVATGLLLVSLKACSFSGGPIDGVVIDQTTKQPIADVIVVALWYGSWAKIPAESHTACYHAETARTDAQGRYHISAWVSAPTLSSLLASHESVGVRAYKPGYVELISEDAYTTDKLQMKPFVGTKKEYFDTVLSGRGWGCDAIAGASLKNLYQLYAAAAADAREKAETPEQEGIASFFQWRAEDSKKEEVPQ